MSFFPCNVVLDTHSVQSSPWTSIDGRKSNGLSNKIFFVYFIVCFSKAGCERMNIYTNIYKND